MFLILDLNVWILLQCFSTLNLNIGILFQCFWDLDFLDLAFLFSDSRSKAEDKSVDL